MRRSGSTPAVTAIDLREQFAADFADDVAVGINLPGAVGEVLGPGTARRRREHRRRVRPDRLRARSVSGRQCMRIQGRPASATTRAMSASARPPETSLT